LETFHRNISQTYNEIINEFYNIKNSILENKKELTNAEEQYKESFMYLNELSRNIINTTVFDDAQNKYNECKRLYTYKFQEMNKLLDIYNKQYIQLQNKLYRNEESELFFQIIFLITLHIFY
jgi:hypothetical protein